MRFPKRKLRIRFRSPVVVSPVYPLPAPPDLFFWHGRFEYDLGPAIRVNVIAAPAWTATRALSGQNPYGE